MKPNQGFASFSYITPVALRAFLLLFYAPLIANLLREQRGAKAETLGVGLLIPVTWLILTSGITQTPLLRFAKLREALGWIMYGLPIVGMFVIAFGQVAVTPWHLVY